MVAALFGSFGSCQRHLPTQHIPFQCMGKKKAGSGKAAAKEAKKAKASAKIERKETKAQKKAKDGDDHDEGANLEDVLEQVRAEKLGRRSD